MTASLKSRAFGFLSTGKSVEAWTLTGRGGLVLEAITYGGIVTRVLAPDRNGRLDDVVLGFNDLDSYLAGHPYFGAITGRVSGRITGAEFNLEGKTYTLTSNDPPNHLHGGVQGFDQKIWNAVPMNGPDGAPSLRLSYRSPDGEEGYPGTVNVSVTYTVTNENTYLIETEAVTDYPTPFNLSHHSYFNLAGESSGSIADHELQIHADESVTTDVHMTLLGRVESVRERENDFRRPRRVGDALPLLFKNHGDLYLIRKAVGTNLGPTLVPAARLLHRGSGRVLDVFTTETHLQLYTGALLDGSLVGKSGTAYARHAGLCLECHGYPDGVNAPGLGDITLRPGQHLRRATEYTFCTAALVSTSAN
jgi:aldose 1-epimerase